MFTRLLANFPHGGGAETGAGKDFRRGFEQLLARLIRDRRSSGS
jgi:hypothetical protein